MTSPCFSNEFKFLLSRNVVVVIRFLFITPAVKMDTEIIIIIFIISVSLDEMLSLRLLF